MGWVAEVSQAPFLNVARTHNLIGVDVFLPSLVVILVLKTMPKDAAPDVMPDLRMCNLFDTSGKVRQWAVSYTHLTLPTNREV